MAEAISTLLQKPSQRKAMGASGRSRVEQAFSITRTAHAFNEVLATIVFKNNRA
jgi:glycosyltransferase involved in cell wall biosynthesis